MWRTRGIRVRQATGGGPRRFRLPCGAAPASTFIGFRADVATAVLSALLMSVIVARGLGPGNRGVFFLALLVASVIALVGNLGLSTASIVFAATREIPLAQLHGIALLFSFGAALAGAAVLLVAEEFWTSEVFKGLNTGPRSCSCAWASPPPSMRG